MHLMNEHHEVMTEHLAQRFVLHGSVRLGAERIAKYVHMDRIPEYAR